MKLSLISATSIVALFSAYSSPTRAAIVNIDSGQSIVFDLAQGLSPTRSSGMTVPLDPAALAAQALRSVSGGLQSGGFTGRLDYAVTIGSGFTSVPMGAVAGSKRNDEVASTVLGENSVDPIEVARMVGRTRMSALIGTISGNRQKQENLGGTVFVAVGTLSDFNDNGGMATAARATGTAVAFGPGSSSTATITMASALNSSRQRPGGSFYTVDGATVQTKTLASGDASPINQVRYTDIGATTRGFQYAPGLAASSGRAPLNAAAQPSEAMTAAPGNATKTVDLPAGFNAAVTARRDVVQAAPSYSDRVVDVTPPLSTVSRQTGQTQLSKLQRMDIPASFSEAVTASGAMPRVTMVESRRFIPAGPRVPGTDGPAQSEAVLLNYKQLLEVTRNLEITRRETDSDGTQVYISASVSADPSANIVRFMSMIVRPTVASPTNRSVEAFQIGTPSGSKAIKISTINDPLGIKVMASGGPLNDTLALP